MTQYIGQITVIIDADDESIAETSIRGFAQRIEDESDALVFADHNGDVENYEEIERTCKRSLESAPTPSLASVAPRLLASLITCANLLAPNGIDACSGKRWDFTELVPNEGQCGENQTFGEVWERLIVHENCPFYRLVLADYDESEGEEGQAWREAVAAIAEATGRAA